MKPGQDRAFVIGSPTTVQLLSVAGNGQLERLGVPAVFLGSRLNVKVAIDNQSFFLRVLAQLAKDHRGKLELGPVRPENYISSLPNMKYFQMISKKRLNL